MVVLAGKGPMVSKDEIEEAWVAQLGAAGAAFAAWRRAYPRATLDEIEDAYDGLVREVRAGIISEAATLGEGRRACPECSALMVRRGQRERRLLAKDGGLLRLQRSYQSCPACGVELFPPG